MRTDKDMAAIPVMDTMAAPLAPRTMMDEMGRGAALELRKMEMITQVPGVLLQMTGMVCPAAMVQIKVPRGVPSVVIRGDLVAAVAVALGTKAHSTTARLAERVAAAKAVTLISMVGEVLRQKRVLPILAVVVAAEVGRMTTRGKLAALAT
jgi:hypothetical protein